MTAFGLGRGKREREKRKGEERKEKERLFIYLSAVLGMEPGTSHIGQVLNPSPPPLHLFLFIRA
jgi:hypothetical protein